MSEPQDNIQNPPDDALPQWGEGTIEQAVTPDDANDRLHVPPPDAVEISGNSESSSTPITSDSFPVTSNDASLRKELDRLSGRLTVAESKLRSLESRPVSANTYDPSGNVNDRFNRDSDQSLKMWNVLSGDMDVINTPTGTAMSSNTPTNAGTLLPSINEGRHENPKVLGGIDDIADEEEWDVDDQEEGFDGVAYSPYRLYWSGTSGDPVYQFIRTATHDSLGCLVYVSAEMRTVAFGTGDCEA